MKTIRQPHMFFNIALLILCIIATTTCGEEVATLTDSASDLNLQIESFNDARLPQNISDLRFLPNYIMNQVTNVNNRRSHWLDLMEFIVKAVIGKGHLILLHDNDVAGVTFAATSASIKSFGHFADLTIMTFDPKLELLLYLRKVFQRLYQLQIVLVMCQPHNVAELFTKVRERSLESTWVHWIIITDSHTTEDLSSILREGSQVTVIEQSSIDRYRLLASRMQSNGQIGFDTIGWWQASNKSGESGGGYIRDPLVPDRGSAYDDMMGRELRVAVVDNWPFFGLKTSKEDGSTVPDSGIDASVIETLSKSMNFTYRIVIPADEGWGGPQPDGSVSGMIGMISRHEAHMAIDEITITGSRETVADFTRAYFVESSIIVSRAPRIANQAFAVFSPFTAVVWVGIVVSVLLMGPLVQATSWVYNYIRPSSAQVLDWSEVQLNIYRNLVVQGNLLKLFPIVWPLRMVFVTWYFFCFIIYALYAGTLTAVLAAPSLEQPIDSLPELLEASQSGVVFTSVIQDSSIQSLLKEAAPGSVYNDLYLAFKPGKSLVSSVADGLQGVLEERSSYLDAALSMKLNTKRLGEDKFYLSRERFYMQSYGIACNIGSPIKIKLDALLPYIEAAGLISKWTNDQVNKLQGGKSDSSGDNNDMGPSSLSIIHLQGAFYICTIGFTSAVIALLLELLIEKMQRKHC